MNPNNINKLSFFDNYELLNKESIVLDVGANTGEVTDYIFKKYKCNIYAYEPNPACYNHMKNKYSKIDKIIVNNCAISNFNGSDFLYFHYDAKGNDDIRYIQGATLRKEKDNIDVNKRIKVKIQNIKDILSSFNKIDLIKIDIEGSEYNILPQLIKNKNKIGIVLCEMHGNPDGKKINGKHKNKNFTSEYKSIVLELKRLGLYNNWFYEWH